MFERWDWLDREQFRKDFGLIDIIKWTDTDIAKATRYGCMRVDLECGGSIREILDGKKFPGNLTENQADTVLEAASWCANHALKQGLEWLRGSSSVSMGQISTGQTNPDEPDYFLPFLYKKLVGAGLVKFIQAGNISIEEEDNDPMFTWEGTDREFFSPSLDFLKKTYLAKRGQNSLTSKDGSIVIKPNGGLYDGINISTKYKGKDLERRQEELSEAHFQDIGRIEREIAGLEKNKGHLEKQLKAINERIRKNEEKLEELHQELFQDVGGIYRELEGIKDKHKKDVKELEKRIPDIDPRLGELFKYIEVDESMPSNPLRFKY